MPASAVIALLPNAQPDPPNLFIRWSDILSALFEAQRILEESQTPDRDMDGYLLLVRELRDRILTHEHCIAG